MKHPFLAAAIIASSLWAPVAAAQGAGGPQQGNAPAASEPSGQAPRSGENGANQRGQQEAPQDAEQGREEAAPPHQGGSGCPYRQRPLELIV